VDWGVEIAVKFTPITESQESLWWAAIDLILELGGLVDEEEPENE